MRHRSCRDAFNRTKLDRMMKSKMPVAKHSQSSSKRTRPSMFFFSYGEEADAKVIVQVAEACRKWLLLRACLNGVGGPQASEVTSGGSLHLPCKCNQIIKMRDYVDRRVTPPTRVTSPTWGLPPPCKRVLSHDSNSSGH